jgi:tetratricopeptide (TPR) repeat protein
MARWAGAGVFEMSVINRMLRDLDERQRQEQTQKAAPAAAVAPTFPWAWLLGLFVIISIAVVLAVALWPRPAPESTLTTTTEKYDKVNSSREVTEQAEATTLSEASAVSPSVSEPAKQEVQQLADASQRPSSGPQESTPQQTIAVPSAEPQAKPSRLAEEEIIARDSSVSTSTRQKGSRDLADTGNDQTEAASGQLEIEAAELSQEQLALLKFEQAKEALAKGERSRGGSLLEQVIALAPEHVNARIELAAYWYGKGRVNDALAVLEQGLKLVPEQSRWQLLYARILYNIGAYRELTDALQQIPTDTPEAPELMQLRASSANELARYAAAAADYAWLARQTNAGRWWLAAAVAYEDAAQLAQASHAYRQALNAPNLNDDGLSYARQRLQALGEQ